jgi:hypothetical protein
MPYLGDWRLNPVEMWRDVVQRNIELLWRIAHTFFGTGEQLTHSIDPDGLGVWIGVRSTARPEGLLRRIQEETFRSFAFLGVRFDANVYWHFRAM